MTTYSPREVGIEEPIPESPLNETKNNKNVERCFCFLGCAAIVLVLGCFIVLISSSRDCIFGNIDCEGLVCKKYLCQVSRYVVALAIAVSVTLITVVAIVIAILIFLCLSYKLYILLELTLKILGIV